MKVYVVDNGGQWTHREWRVLRCLGVETRMVPNTTPFGELKDLDGLVLSGGAPNVACDGSRMGNGAEYIDRAEYPVLGICAGMQLMCQRFGSEVGPADTPEFGEVELKVSDHSDLFRGLPDEFIAWGSHNDEVKSVPAGFRVTASSPSCGIEAVACVDRPLYGVQFHPEVENTQHGSEMFRNFLGIIVAQRRRGSRREGSGKSAPEGRQATQFPLAICSSWLMICQIWVLACRGMFASFARSSRMLIAEAARTSSASFVSSTLAFASWAPLLMFLGTEVSSARMSIASVACLMRLSAI